MKFIKDLSENELVGTRVQNPLSGRKGKVSSYREIDKSLNILWDDGTYTVMSLSRAGNFVVIPDNSDLR